MKNFFEKYTGLWGFLAIPAALLIAVVWWAFFPNEKPWNVTTTNGEKSLEITTTKGEKSPIISGSHNTVSYVETPTKTKESMDLQWQECETKLRAFYRRLDRKVIPSARNMFDEHMLKSEVFLEERLNRFTSAILSGNFILDSIERQWIDDTAYVSRCEFQYRLKYIDKRTGGMRNELWFGVVIKNKDKTSDFQIGQLSCRDKICENWPLVKKPIP